MTITSLHTPARRGVVRSVNISIAVWLLNYLALWRGRVCGTRSPVKLTFTAAPAEPVLPYNEITDNGSRIVNPVPRCRQRNDMAKNQLANGLAGQLERTEKR